MASPSPRRAIARASGSAPRASRAAATRRSGVIRAFRSREVDAPRIPLGLEGARGLDRQSALPHARRPRQRHEAVLAQQLDHLGDLLLAADERRRRGREVPAAPRRHRDGGDRRIVREDRLLESPQVGAGLERQLRREHPPRLMERLERVGLAAAAVQREHQLPPQPLPERVLLERLTNRGDDVVVIAQRERGLELLFESVDSKRLESPRLRAEPGGVGEPMQRRAAPELQRGRGGLGRGAGVARMHCTARVSEQHLETQCIDTRVRQHVSVGRGDDRLLAERSAKTSDVMLDGVARRGRQVVPPQRVDQRIDADDATAAKRKQREEALALATAHVRRPSTDDDLDRSEQPDFERVVHAVMSACTASLARSGTRG